ncbi:hypothetical protein X801_09643, partial [Opisthorchis viverrini]
MWKICPAPYVTFLSKRGSTVYSRVTPEIDELLALNPRVQKFAKVIPTAITRESALCYSLNILLKVNKTHRLNSTLKYFYNYLSLGYSDQKCCLLLKSRSSVTLYHSDKSSRFA